MKKVDISLVDDLIDEKNAEIKRLTEALESILSATTSDVYSEVGAIEVIEMNVKPTAKKALSK